ncbi:MAG: cell division protein FtsZ [Deltaproteobacteria bacterium]|nr:cell division protein FtsZ [Deltaproteobacteria bacterium]
MVLSIDFAQDANLQAKIKVIGVGGAGGNAINTMIESGLEGVEFIAANTDVQSLHRNLAPEKIQIGTTVTRGLGAGGKPEIGRKSALEDVQKVSEILQGADMVFITAGMGGGTGTGAAPIISQIARDQGALTVAVVTKPFVFEGSQRSRYAEAGLEELTDSVDTVITIPNEKLVNLAEDNLSALEAFKRTDDVLVQAVRGISDLIVNTGMINVDFADVKTIMSATGRALMGTGYGRGEHRAQDAAQLAINSPLLDDISVEGATGILINFTAGADIKLKEIHEAASVIRERADNEAHIIFGLVTDESMADMVKVTVIATGFDMRRSASLASGSRYAHHAISVPTSCTGRPSNVGIAASELKGHSFSSVALSRPRPEKRDVIANPLRRPSERPQQVSLPVVNPVRAFGATAISDEHVLEIPAFMRKNGANPNIEE